MIATLQYENHDTLEAWFCTPHPRDPEIKVYMPTAAWVGLGFPKTIEVTIARGKEPA